MWLTLATKSLAGTALTRDEARSVLHAPADELLALLDAAFTVRRAHWGRRVSLHVLDNAKVGACPEDCGFCSQSSKYSSPSGEGASLVNPWDFVLMIEGSMRFPQSRLLLLRARRGERG